ncbi:hypothetical protein GCM10007298_00090 [Williamsia phyllosphaerae]|uniref:Uncharacterized protein n=2 Tax=Williamsia phyllosphaerae TaxID=885042 RepID=A0ABQ1U4E9_9NOCA|nr:hypothetical protein GCM10007298_00090 [Williamsia phyllosphaerae]
MTEGAGHAPAPGHDPTAGHGPSVMDMLEHSGVAPLLHMPVGDVLASLKLPPLPQLPPMPPLPHLPPLPTIDIASLFKPLTDLLSGFGSGNMANAPFDPTQLLSGLQQAFESVTGLGTQAMTMVAPFWAGAGGTAAITKGVEANGNGVATGAQSGDISRIVGVATATVGKGVALLQAIIAKFVASVAAFMPFITTPVGVAGIMASASEHLAEGMVVVGETRAELTAHTANMSFTGAPVPITAAPQMMSSIPGMASTAVQAVSSPIQSIVGAFGGAGAAGGGSLAARSASLRTESGPDLAAAKTASAGAGGGGGGGGVAGMGGLAGLGGAATNPTGSLSSRPSDSPVGPGRGASSSTTEEVTTTRASTTSAMAPGGMPMAGAAGAGASSATHSRDTPVDARYADDVVGEVPTASPSVLGGVEAPVAQSVWDSPDELES